MYEDRNRLEEAAEPDARRVREDPTIAETLVVVVFLGFLGALGFSLVQLLAW